MTTSDDAHWFKRCGKAAQEWLLHNPGSALTTAALDAVIGAGGTPIRRHASEDDRSEAFYLHPADSEYLIELRAAGISTGAR